MPPLISADAMNGPIYPVALKALFTRVLMPAKHGTNLQVAYLPEMSEELDKPYRPQIQISSMRSSKQKMEKDSIRVPTVVQVGVNRVIGQLQVTIIRRSLQIQRMKKLFIR